MTAESLYIIAKPLTSRMLLLLSEKDADPPPHVEILATPEVAAQLGGNRSIRILAANEHQGTSTTTNSSSITAHDAVEMIFRARRVIVL
jgi:hypothetical protein